MATNTDATRGRSSSKEPEHAGAFTLPIIHTDVTIEHAAYFGALGVLAALEVIEWPLATVLIVGHVVADRAHRRVFREIASGFDEAV
jgi:hypothetical protein